MEVELPADVPAVQSDSTRVSEILGNIISNAIKYTPAGRIVVAVGDRCDASGRRHAVVEVTDSGPGIPRGQHELIFTEFYRLSGAPGTSGAGIGLAISQQLALALGGRLTVDSELGRGSTFTLWLPLGPVGAVEPGSGVAVEASHDGDTVPC